LHFSTTATPVPTKITIPAFLGPAISGFHLTGYFEINNISDNDHNIFTNANIKFNGMVRNTGSSPSSFFTRFNLLNGDLMVGRQQDRLLTLSPGQVTIVNLGPISLTQYDSSEDVIGEILVIEVPSLKVLASSSTSVITSLAPGSAVVSLPTATATPVPTATATATPVPTATAAQPTLVVEDGQGSVGQSISVEVALENASNGVSGYRQMIFIQDSLVARILDVKFADYGDPDTGFTLTAVSDLPGQSATFSAVDLSGEFDGSFSRKVLVILTIELLASGQTQIVASNTSDFDDDSGNALNLILVSGTLTVN